MNTFFNQFLVHTINGVPVTDSVTLAKSFNKSHPKVLRAIRTILDNLGLLTISQLTAICEAGGGEESADYRANFGLVEYKDKKGEMRPYYILNRTAFMLLVMGFTGQQALAIKLQFIAAFDHMESQLQAQATRYVAAFKQTHTRLSIVVEHPTMARNELTP